MFEGKDETISRQETDFGFDASGVRTKVVALLKKLPEVHIIQKIRRSRVNLLQNHKNRIFYARISDKSDFW